MPTKSSPKAIVIGSGFGGLSAAIRLQAAGANVTLVEKRDKPGGRAYVYEEEGHVFDAGPTVLTAPDCLKELFQISGKNIEDYVSLVPVHPFYRLLWEDGFSFDYSNDEKALFDQIQKKSPGDVAGYKKFFNYSKAVYQKGYEELVDVPFQSFWSMLRVAPDLIRLRADRSVYATVARFIKDPQLRQAFSFHSLLIGGNPFSSSSIYALIHYLERNGGFYFAMGGTGKLVSGFVRLFQDLGGKVLLDSPVEEILTDQGKVTGVRLKSKDALPADIVVSNADVVHTYDALLKKEPRAASPAKKFKKRPHSMSLFVLHFGTRVKYPNLAHHTVMFGRRYKELLTDIFKKGVLADDFSLYLHRPTATDPSMAPEGRDTFYVLSPVPHLGKANIDWDEEGPKYADKIISYLEERYMPNLKENISAWRLFTPNDFKTELNAHWGSAFSLEPILAQSAYFRTHNRDDKIKGLYFAGAGTHPGAGLPGVINSGKATARLIYDDFNLKRPSKQKPVPLPNAELV